MKHPTPDELSAFHDGLLTAGELVAVERHVSECAACHEALEALEGQDRALAATLSHDPGDVHFEALAARIERDLAAYAPERRAATESGVARAAGKAGGGRAAGKTGDGAAASGWLAGATAAARERLAALLGRARKMTVPAWAGATLALVVAVGLLLLNLDRIPGLRDPALERRVGQAADQVRAGRDDGRQLATRETEAPAEEEAPSARSRAVTPPAGTSAKRADAPRQAGARAERAAAPATGAKAPAAGGAQSAAPARAYEVKRTASGEDVRVRKQEGAFAQAPPATAPAEGGRTVPLKPQLAQPLAASQPGTDAKESVAAPAKETSAIANESFGYAKDESSAKKAGTGARALDATAGSATEPGTATRSGAGQIAAAPAPAPPAPAAASGEAPLVRVCGVVKDSFGRPIPSASVTIATRGSGSTADAAGRFCIDAPVGEHTLSVYAVGFGPLRVVVRMASGAEPLALTLHAVPVIQDATAKALMLKSLSGVPQTGSPEDGLRAFPDSLQPVASRAVRMTLSAERAKSAPQYEAAAAEWEKVRARATDSTGEIEARYRIAEARYQAWQLAPTDSRSSAAHEALTSFLVRAPLGPQRDRASAWLGKVKHSPP